MKLVFTFQIKFDLESETRQSPKTCADQEGGGVWTPILEKHKALSPLTNTDPDPLENYKATQSLVNVDPPSARQLHVNAI